MSGEELKAQYPSLELCVQFSEDGQHIRKWSRIPFDGGTCLYSHPIPEQPQEGWRTIESAPKDGAKFIGLTKDGRAATMSWRNSVKGWKQKEDGGWVPESHHLVLCEEDSDSICPREAAHWMPFPSPPPTETKESGE